MGKLTRSRELFLDSMGGGAWPFLVGGYKVDKIGNKDGNKEFNILERSCLPF